MTQAELIWGAFSLMFLGALVTMCMKCTQTGDNQDKTGFNGQTEQNVAADYSAPVGRERHPAQAQTHSWSLRYEDQRRLETPYSYLSAGEEYLKSPYNMLGGSQSSTRPSLPSPLEIGAESRYRNLDKEIPRELEAAYVEPLSRDRYCNTNDFSRPSKDEDSPSYQNVSGPSKGAPYDLANVEIYENSTIIQLWKHSQIQGDASDGDDDEPDYINAGSQRR